MCSCCRSCLCKACGRCLFCLHPSWVGQVQHSCCGCSLFRGSLLAACCLGQREQLHEAGHALSGCRTSHCCAIAVTSFAICCSACRHLSCVLSALPADAVYSLCLLATHFGQLLQAEGCLRQVLSMVSRWLLQYTAAFCTAPGAYSMMQGLPLSAVYHTHRGVRCELQLFRWPVQARSCSEEQGGQLMPGGTLCRQCMPLRR